MAEDNGSADAGNPESEANNGGVDSGAAVPASSTGSILDSIKDESLRTYAEGKGFHRAGFEGVVKSYSHLEKIMSADKAGRTVVLLGDDPTPEEVDGFYSRLGRPQDPKGYEIKAPEGDDGKFAEWAAGTFHAAGLSQKQAVQVVEAWEQYAGGVREEQATQAHVSAVDAEAALKKEWGAAYDANVKAVNQAAAGLGMTDEQLSGLRSAMGPVEAMKFVHSFHAKIGDDIMDSGEARDTNVMTPAQARQELGELTMKQEFMDAWLNKNHPGHAAAVAKKASLAQMINGQSPQ